jgi:3-oxoacyl-[acyl-carrier-protein] synthase II
LDDAGLKPKDIDYICLDGAATKLGDASEATAIRQVFNGEGQSVICSAPKSIFGNMLGATGAVDVITTLLAMESSMVPPTINLKDPDPQCDLNHCANKAVEKTIDNALVINRGRGGINCVLALQKAS